MKKTILLLFALIIIKSAFEQTRLTPLPATSVRSHRVTPVRVDGTDDYFYFEGYGGQKPGCFKINNGVIDLTKCDKFTFEFAEFYNGNPNIPLYYIQRIDGNCLTFTIRGAAFEPKHRDIFTRFQKWLISKEISAFPPHYTNSYFLFLPLATVPYGSTLTMFDLNKKIGCFSNLNVNPSESEFYIGQTPKKTFNDPHH